MDRQTVTYLVFFIVIALILGLRIWRGSRARRLKVERMWIRPAIILTFLGVSIYSQPPPMAPVILAVLALVTAAGGVMGWYRGRMVKVSIDPETHALTSRASPWGMLIFLGLVVVRVAARMMLGQEHDVAGVPVAAIIDGLTLFYAGNVVGLQVEVWMRAKKLLAGAIAAKAAGEAVPKEVTQDHAGERPHG
ncbi:MAG TPA: hypothetical protein VFV70_07625 [Hyphomonadaceae bacterium]|nr:hypothetical protein [Hyphomonadaceae bacterium]